MLAVSQLQLLHVRLRLTKVQPTLTPLLLLIALQAAVPLKAAVPPKVAKLLLMAAVLLKVAVQPKVAKLLAKAAAPLRVAKLPKLYANSETIRSMAHLAVGRFAF